MSYRYIRISGNRFESPRKGTPPPPPYGYQTSSYDKYIYVPILTPCEHREERGKPSPNCGCGGLEEMHLFCKDRNQKVLPIECRKCPLYKA